MNTSISIEVEDLSNLIDTTTNENLIKRYRQIHLLIDSIVIYHLVGRHYQISSDISDMTDKPLQDLINSIRIKERYKSNE